MELSGEVVDSPQAVITAQVEAGVVVRMAVLYELLAGGGRQAQADEGQRQGENTTPGVAAESAEPADAPVAQGLPA